MNWRKTWMEDDLKIWKVEYLSNPWSDLIGIKSEFTEVSNEDDLQQKRTSIQEKWNISATTGWIYTQILNLSYKCTKLPNKENISEYFRNHSNLSHWGQTIVYKGSKWKTTSNERQPPKWTKVLTQGLNGDYLKIHKKGNISAMAGQILLKVEPMQYMQKT
jgi:hypothetical protein